MADAGLVEVHGDRWDDELRRLGLTDAYLGRGFVAASAELVSATPTLLRLPGADGDIVFAALVRDEPCDVVSPYGYGGPVGVGDEPPFARFARAYEAWCATRGVVTSFVVFHPLYGNAVRAPELGFHAVPLAGTVAWSLGHADLRARMHKHHRRMVRRADAAGLVSVIDAAPSDLSAFVELYTAAMRRLHASPFYLFSPAYWRSLLTGARLVRVDVVDAAGRLMSAVLGMGTPPWLHYHLGATSEAARGTGASQLALLALAEWGRAQGYDVLHLGGGVSGRADSLLEFKLRFSPDGLIPAATGRAVHDPAAYARLTGSEAVDWQGFFPAYRAGY